MGLALPSRPLLPASRLVQQPFHNWVLQASSERWLCVTLQCSQERESDRRLLPTAGPVPGQLSSGHLHLCCQSRDSSCSGLSGWCLCSRPRTKDMACPSGAKGRWAWGLPLRGGGEDRGPVAASCASHLTLCLLPAPTELWPAPLSAELAVLAPHPPPCLCPVTKRVPSCQSPALRGLWPSSPESAPPRSIVCHLPLSPAHRRAPSDVGLLELLPCRARLPE